jgi:dTDP-4-dehydrorhamnose reductase
MIFQLIKNQELGIFNVGTDKIISRYEFAKLIADEWNLDVNLIKPISTKSLKAQNKNYIAPRPLKSGLLVRDKFPKISIRDSLVNLKKI